MYHLVCVLFDQCPPAAAGSCGYERESEETGTTIQSTLQSKQTIFLIYTHSHFSSLPPLLCLPLPSIPPSLSPLSLSPLPPSLPQEEKVRLEEIIARLQAGEGEGEERTEEQVWTTNKWLGISYSVTTIATVLVA